MRDKLTARRVETIQANPKKRVEVFDTLQPGLALRVTEQGKKSWSVMYRVAGAATGGLRGPLRRMTIGAYPLVSLQDARQKAREAIDAADHGRDLALLKKSEAQQRHLRTFESILELYLELHVRPMLVNGKAVEKLLTERALPHWRGRDIQSISRPEVHELLDHLIKDRHHGTARELRKHLTGFFGWTADRGYVSASPAAGMRRPDLRFIARERVLSMDELKALWRTTDAINYPFGPWFKILILTAQRRGEIADLRRAWILDDGTAIEFPSAHYKTKRPHVVPLSSPAKDIIQSLPLWNQGDFLFSTEAGRKAISGFSKFKLRLDEASGVADWTYHDIRRSVATHMARMGVLQEHIERVLGHVVEGVAGTYNRYSYFDEKLAALETWGRQWD